MGSSTPTRSARRRRSQVGTKALTFMVASGGSVPKSTPMPPGSRRTTSAVTSSSPASRGSVTRSFTSSPTVTSAFTRSFMPERLTSMTSPVTSRPSDDWTMAGHGTATRGFLRRSRVVGGSARSPCGPDFVEGLISSTLTVFTRSVKIRGERFLTVWRAARRMRANDHQVPHRDHAGALAGGQGRRRVPVHPRRFLREIRHRLDLAVGPPLLAHAGARGHDLAGRHRRAHPEAQVRAERARLALPDPGSRGQGNGHHRLALTRTALSGRGRRRGAAARVRRFGRALQGARPADGRDHPYPPPALDRGRGVLSG